MRRGGHHPRRHRNGVQDQQYVPAGLPHNSLVHKQLIASASVTGNGTAQPRSIWTIKYGRAIRSTSWRTTPHRSVLAAGTRNGHLRERRWRCLSITIPYTGGCRPVLKYSPCTYRLSPECGSRTSVRWCVRGPGVGYLGRLRSFLRQNADLYGRRSRKTSMEVVYNTTTRSMKSRIVDGLGGT